MKTHPSILGLLGIGILAAACSSGAAGNAESSNQDLSKSECDRIVGAALSKAVDDCNKTESDAQAKADARGKLEDAVVTAVAGFGDTLGSYAGADAAAVSAVVQECENQQCSGELQRGDTKATCSVEAALLKAACYVRNTSKISTALESLDMTKNFDALKAAWTAMDQNWWSLATQEASLSVQHAACAPYAGSAAQRTKLYATCRASCDAQDATSVTEIQTGSGKACVPAGYEQVKDDVGTVVDCGTMQRPLRSLGAVCQCIENSCTQFASLSGSSDRGKPCTPNGAADPQNASGKLSLVWDSAAQQARLECR